MILYGKNSVLERLKTNPKTIKNIFLEEGFSNKEIEELIKKNNIKLAYLSKNEFKKINPIAKLGGIVAKISDFEYADFDDLIKDSKKILIFLDRVCDPQNLGAIIRNCACFGNISIIIPKYKAVNVNETVLHIASGGENYVDISLVSNLVNSIIKAKDAGFWIVSASLDYDSKNIYNFSFPFPLGIVFGSEGEGIRAGINKHIDFKVKIPMYIENFSFNVAFSVVIFCFEVFRQLNLNGKNK
jgi:23S rRNA (guanosine2251-2'-O)-methyltransferase